MTDTRIEMFLAHLDDLTGGAEPRFLPVHADAPARTIFALAYSDIPEPGMITAVTYGLSRGDHRDWRFGKPELTISVTSPNVDWATAIASIARDSAATGTPCTAGSVYHFRTPIVQGCPMTAMMMFHPAVFTADQATIDVHEDRPIRLVGCYPIHPTEAEYIRSHGATALWQLDVDWNPYDVNRPAVV